MATKQNLVGLLTHTIAMKGTDLHICPGASPFIRVNGKLERMDIEPLSSHDIKGFLDDTFMLDVEKKKKIHTENSIAYSFSISGIGRFRACVYTQRGTTAATIRILPYAVPSLEELGYGEEHNKIIMSFAIYEKGLFFVAGHTGSGKSTTLAAIVNHINASDSKHITTVENPIEYLHMHKNSIVTQKEVRSDITDTETAIQWAITQNADVIIIDDLEKTEKSMMIAVAAAEEKLVFACLKTTSVIENVREYFDDILHSGDSQKMNRLSNALEGVIYQRFEGGRFTSQITTSPLKDGMTKRRVASNESY